MRSNSKINLNAQESKRASPPPTGQAGFTLLEVIIVVSLMVILLVGVVLVLNPVQLLGRARDSQRQTDVGAIVDAIEFTSASGQTKERGGVDLDGANTDTCSGEASATVYVSVPDGNGSGGCTAPPDDLPTGWTYGCANNGLESSIDGTGWVPIDLTQGGSTTSPISHLPSDPTDSWASGHYYTYVCDRSGTYEITARMVSNKFRTGGEDDIQSTDGGDDIFVYETGTDLTLYPFFQETWGSSGSGSDWTAAQGADYDWTVVDERFSHAETIVSGRGRIAGTMAMWRANSYAYVAGEAAIDLEATMDFEIISMDSNVAMIFARRTAIDTYYYLGACDSGGTGVCEAAAGYGLAVYKKVNDIDTILGEVTMGLSVGTVYRLRVFVQGDELKVKIWDSAAPEPGSWDLERTDSEISGSGEFGIKYGTSAMAETHFNDFTVHRRQ